jgi:hypothetical protein
VAAAIPFSGLFGLVAGDCPKAEVVNHDNANATESLMYARFIDMKRPPRSRPEMIES